MVPFWRCTTRRRRAVSSPSVVLREMVSFDTTKTNSLGAWRGVGAWTASRFMASRALSWGARTNGAVCAAPGGSRHHLYHRLSFLRWEEARGEARAGREQLHRGAGAGRGRLRLRRCLRADAGEARRVSVASALAGAADGAALVLLVLLVPLVFAVADKLLEQAVPRGGVAM